MVNELERHLDRKRKSRLTQPPPSSPTSTCLAGICSLLLLTLAEVKCDTNVMLNETIVILRKFVEGT